MMMPTYLAVACTSPAYHNVIFRSSIGGPLILGNFAAFLDRGDYFGGLQKTFLWALLIVNYDQSLAISAMPRGQTAVREFEKNSWACKLRVDIDCKIKFSDNNHSTAREDIFCSDKKKAVINWYCHGGCCRLIIKNNNGHSGEESFFHFNGRSGTPEKRIKQEASSEDEGGLEKKRKWTRSGERGGWGGGGVIVASWWYDWGGGYSMLISFRSPVLARWTRKWQVERDSTDPTLSYENARAHSTAAAASSGELREVIIHAHRLFTFLLPFISFLLNLFFFYPALH